MNVWFYNPIGEKTHNLFGTLKVPLKDFLIKFGNLAFYQNEGWVFNFIITIA